MVNHFIKKLFILKSGVLIYIYIPAGMIYEKYMMMKNVQLCYTHFFKFKGIAGGGIGMITLRNKIPF